MRLALYHMSIRAHSYHAHTFSAPVLGKRSHAADDLGPPWLMELHSKIWNHEEFRPQLFRKVKVTRGDYAALQNRLKELHSDRDSLDYSVDKTGVLDVKLKFLRSLTPVDENCEMETSEDGDSEAMNEVHDPDTSCKGDDSEAMDEVNDSEAMSEDDDPGATREDDDLEASNEDDTILQSLFPSILSFLDLSTLNLKITPPGRFPQPLLLRREYKKLSALIENRPRSSGGSVMISGQPGTGEFFCLPVTRSNQLCRYQGKTSYLYLRIVESMIEGRTFLYQNMNGVVYHVSEMGVQAVQSWSPTQSIVAFVDGDKGDYQPDENLIHRSVQLIVAASPKGANQKWTKQLGESARMLKLAIKLWSHKELLLTGLVLALLSTLD